MIERTVKFATVVDSMPEAFAFVMEYLDEVGPDASVHISPVWWLGDGNESTRRFEVAVDGMFERTPSSHSSNRAGT